MLPTSASVLRRLSWPLLCRAAGAPRIAASPFSSTPARPSRRLPDGDLVNINGAFDLSNKNFVITGGGRGIGYAAARAIAEMGGNVSVLDLRPEPAKDFETLAGKFGVATKYVPTDVTSEESLKAGFEEAVADFKSLDGLVTAAGIVLEGRFTTFSRAEVSKILDINVAGTFFAAQLAAKKMMEDGTGGSIVLIASVSGSVATPGHRLSPYNTSKGAVKMLGTALAAELGPDSIRVNTVSPGYIDTEMLTPLKEQYPERIKLMTTKPAIKRIGNRNDLTPAIVYLLSDASTYTTGTDLSISGALHCGLID